MANSQLTAYVTAQLDKGVSRDAIAQALIGAGWMQADVDAAITEVVQQRASSATSPAAASPVAAAAQPAVTEQSYTAAQPAASSNAVTPASFFSTTGSTPVDGSIAIAPKKSMAWLFILVGVILAIGIVGGIVYAFFMGGSADIPTITDQNSGQQLSTLQQERDQLQGQVSELSSNITDLENQLGIFKTSTDATVPLTIRGTLATTTANVYTLRTNRDVVLTVANATNAAVAAALSPLVGAEVELSGTHAPVSTLLTVTSVNGSPIQTAPATP
jgi:TolA-binding protein